MKKYLLFAFFSFFLTIFSFFTNSNSGFQLTGAQKMWLDNMENVWIEPFRKLLNYNEQEIQLILDTIAKMKTERFNWLCNQKNIDHIHDEKIPKTIMEKIYKILQKYEINPYRINIKFNQAKTDYFAETVEHLSIKAFYTIKNETIGFDFEYNDNPTIWIYEKLYKQSDDSFENTILHELGHLIEAHSGQKVLLRMILDQKKVPKNERDVFLKQLTYVIELIADQRLTINNIRIIENMIKEYGESEGNKQIIQNLLSKTSIQNLNIVYDKTDYPSYLARWISLHKMKSALYPNVDKNYGLLC